MRSWTAFDKALSAVSLRYPAVSVVIADAIARWWTAPKLRAGHENITAYFNDLADQLSSAADAIRAVISAVGSEPADHSTSTMASPTTSAGESMSPTHSHEPPTSAASSKDADQVDADPASSIVVTPEMVQRFARYYEKHPAWGVLHVSLEDGNYDRPMSEFVAFHNERDPDPEHAELAAIHDRLSPSQRRRLGIKAEAVALRRRGRRR